MCPNETDAVPHRAVASTSTLPTASTPVQTVDQRASGDSRYARGAATMRSIGIEPANLVETMTPVDPEYAHTVIDYAFGAIISQPGLDLRTRQLITVAVLTAIGGCEAQLETHIPATIRAGASREEIVHAIQQVTPYAGIPRTINALDVAKRVLPHPGE